MTDEAFDALGVVRGGVAYDSDGQKIGAVQEVFADRAGQPSFVTIHTGLFGSRTTFVPLADASVDGDDLRLPYDEAKIKGAPGVEPDADITDEEQDRLYDYYGISGGHPTGTTTSSGGDHADVETVGVQERSSVSGSREDEPAGASIPLTTKAQVQRLAEMRARARAKLDAVRSRSA